MAAEIRRGIVITLNTKKTLEYGFLTDKNLKVLQLSIYVIKRLAPSFFFFPLQRPPFIFFLIVASFSFPDIRSIVPSISSSRSSSSHSLCSNEIHILLSIQCRYFLFFSSSTYLPICCPQKSI